MEAMEKSPRESEIIYNKIMMPADSNPSRRGDELELGSVNGGAILNLIDNVAGMAALRHCRSRVVTASIDHMSFLNPVHVGEMLILKACVNYVGRTSMEVGVRVETENLMTGVRLKTGSAFLTFVCLDKEGNPMEAPKLKLESDLDKRRFEQAKLRLEHRKDLRRKEMESEHFD
ncbi:MAG: acyl-CoA thioesterase [Candidatus Heimdallarchaeota archaeon]|nr:acyl-CoA thioesterase [Candidatus Heimdallarchaeota archaeon]